MLVAVSYLLHFYLSLRGLISTSCRGNGELRKFSFIQPIYQGFTPYYVVPLFKNKIFIQHKYLVEGLSAKQIAQEILCSKMAVLNALVRFGIPIRESHQHHGNPSQPRYGKKFLRKKLVVQQVEHRLIGVMKELREKNLSLREIAGILNGMEVATKNRGKKWHPEMVRRVLNNVYEK